MKPHFADRGSAVAGALFIFLALASGAFYYANVQEQKGKADCQARYNQAFSESLTIRSQLSGARQDAVDELIVGVGQLVSNPPKTPAEERAADVVYRRLFVNFNRVSMENQAVRNANQLPELPNC